MDSYYRHQSRSDDSSKRGKIDMESITLALVTQSHASITGEQAQGGGEDRLSVKPNKAGLCHSRPQIANAAT